jgi:acetylglutamate kinase
VEPPARIIANVTLSALEKAHVLTESLPYIQKFRGKTVVMKYGGHAMDDPRARESFCRDVVLLKFVGLNPVVVHGGGPQIAQMLERLGIKSRFVGGLRVTDDQTMKIVEMVLAGDVNMDIVGIIDRVGGRAVGLSGKDAGLARARRVGSVEGVELGRVGEVVTVDPAVIERMAGSELIPVIAPIALDEKGETVNVNADPFAAKIAAAMHAEKLVLLTDVQGVRGADGKLCSTLTSAQAKQLIKSGVIAGGMIPKVRFGLDAIADGVRKVHIIDGRVEHAVLLEIFTDTGIGTELVQ